MVEFFRGKEGPWDFFVHPLDPDRLVQQVFIRVVTIDPALMLSPYMNTGALGDCPEQRRLPGTVLTDEECDGPVKRQNIGLFEDLKVKRVKIPRWK